MNQTWRGMITLFQVGLHVHLLVFSRGCYSQWVFAHPERDRWNWETKRSLCSLATDPIKASWLRASLRFSRGAHFRLHKLRFVLPRLPHPLPIDLKSLLSPFIEPRGSMNGSLIVCRTFVLQIFDYHSNYIYVAATDD